MAILLKRIRSLGGKAILYGLLIFIAIFMMLPFI